MKLIVISIKIKKSKKRTRKWIDF